MTHDDAIVIHAFETWIHTDDLRRAAGWDLVPPAPEELSVMSEPRVAHPAHRARAARIGSARGKTARLVLTGDGGGDWLIPLGDGDAGSIARRHPHRRRRRLVSPRGRPGLHPTR